MTTLTILPDEEAKTPLISLNPTHTISDIDPLIYGGFTELVMTRQKTSLELPIANRLSV
jgi:hypothetical protein